jgi:predicted lipoprotein with Yx(FWY)xxD motif
MGKIEWRKVAALAVLASPMLIAGRGALSGPTAPTHLSTPPTGAAPPATSTITATLDAATTAPPFYEVQTGRVKGLGSVLVDGQGMTLYLFVPDKQSGQSTCYQRCAQGWPPLLLPAGVTKLVAGRGVKASRLGTTHRKGGTTQITYNRWPLYLWVGDSGPGQATGQGINSLGGLWYVLSPDGKAITTHP